MSASVRQCLPALVLFHLTVLLIPCQLVTPLSLSLSVEDNASCISSARDVCRPLYYYNSVVKKLILVITLSQSVRVKDRKRLTARGKRAALTAYTCPHTSSWRLCSQSVCPGSRRRGEEKKLAEKFLGVRTHCRKPSFRNLQHLKRSACQFFVCMQLQALDCA